MPEPFSITLDLADEAATVSLAEDLALILRAGDVVALQGDLGAGKSTLARALLRALADDPDLEVPSPTFTLVQTYDFGRLSVSHLDLYRIEDPDELQELGFDEAAREGAALVEWPERAEGHLPDNTLWLSIGPGADDCSRRVAFHAEAGDWAARLERTFAIRRFLDDAGWAGAQRRFLQGDASARSYERIRLGGKQAVLMNAPRRADGPPVRDGLPYSQIAHLAEDVRPFVAVDLELQCHWFGAPEIYAHDLDAGLLLLEDLGSDSIIVDGKADRERYTAAIELLAEMHGEIWPAEAPLPDGTVHRVPAYDDGALSIEADLYLDWYVPYVTGAAAPADAAAEFRRLWAELFAILKSSEKTWVLRDYHSPNLIWREGAQGSDRLGLIDFQDTVIGPTAYDVASLAQDARIAISAAMERDLVKHYIARRRLMEPDFDEATFRRDYAILAAHRATKVLGIFVRLNRRDGKPGYLKHLPRLKDYLSRSLAHPALAELRAWYLAHGLSARD